ncbi:MAG: hypothetical protein WCJ29_02540 [bacterium]
MKIVSLVRKEWNEEVSFRMVMITCGALGAFLAVVFVAIAIFPK